MVGVMGGGGRREGMWALGLRDLGRRRSGAGGATAIERVGAPAHAPPFSLCPTPLQPQLRPSREQGEQMVRLARAMRWELGRVLSERARLSGAIDTLRRAEQAWEPRPAGAGPLQARLAGGRGGSAQARGGPRLARTPACPPCRHGRPPSSTGGWGTGMPWALILDRPTPPLPTLWRSWRSWCGRCKRASRRSGMSTAS